jgi:co-chaperonin GroES (HSP10)
VHKYEPVDNLVLLEVEEHPEETVGSIIIPGTAQEVSATGLVLERGPLAYAPIVVGARVLFQPYLAEYMWVEDEHHLALVLDENIFAVITEAE